MWSVLILKRRLDQSLQIGPDVTITVLGIEGGAVILGITAPRVAQVSRSDAGEAQSDHENAANPGRDADK